MSENAVLDYGEMATRLKCSRRMLERLVSKKQIPHKKVGRHVRFYWPEIEAWLSNDKGPKR